MTAAGNRAAAPMIAELMDAAREVFGADQVKLIYAKEGDFERGKPFEPTGDSDGRSVEG